MGVKTRRLAAIGIVTIAVIGAATGVAVADDQHGNKQAVWSMHTDDFMVFPCSSEDCLTSGNEWGNLIKDWTKSDAHDEGSGVSDGVHLAKGNGPTDD
jgi:hypothetical protein